MIGNIIETRLLYCKNANPDIVTVICYSAHISKLAAKCTFENLT